MDIDVNTMPLKDLKDLQAKITKAISTFDARRRKADLAVLEEKAKELGYASIFDLTGEKVSRKRAPALVRYVNPSNPLDSWSGRGRQPRWYAAAIANGITPEQMRS